MESSWLSNALNLCACLVPANMCIVPTLCISCSAVCCSISLLLEKCHCLPCVNACLQPLGLPWSVGLGMLSCLPVCLATCMLVKYCHPVCLCTCFLPAWLLLHCCFPGRLPGCGLPGLCSYLYFVFLINKSCYQLITDCFQSIIEFYRILCKVFCV